MIDRAKRRNARYPLTSGLLFFLLFANFIRFAASRRSPILRRALKDRANLTRTRERGDGDVTAFEMNGSNE